MENINIRRAGLKDVEQLQKIARDTFFESFSWYNTEENMKQYLEENLSTEKLSSELSDENSEIYFAESDNKVIGYLKINFGNSQTDLKTGNGIEIERIYVAQEFHGKNVGQALYQKALAIAEDKDSDYIWLGVWERNPRAISFYKKNGFIEFDKHPFILGKDIQTDIMMKKILEN